MGSRDKGVSMKTYPLEETMFRPKLSKFFLILLLVVGALNWKACGGGAPPASIPAPVSSLLAVSPPDAGGTVTVSGAAGSVLPGATVTGTNATATGLAWEWRNLLLRAAFAQQQGQFQDETIADSLGAFVIRLTASPGDTLFIQQEVNGEFSEITEKQVP